MPDRHLIIKATGRSSRQQGLAGSLQSQRGASAELNSSRIDG